MKNLILALSMFVFLIISCTPAVVFTEPQPSGVIPETSIPVFYQGTFLCDSDSAIVFIDKKMIYKEKDFNVAFSKEEVHTLDDVRLEGDSLYVEFIDEYIPVQFKGDSIFTTITLKDTLFNMGKDHVLTQFRGHQILNKKTNAGTWEVMILSLDYNLNLLLSEAMIPSDLEALEQITPVQDISKEDKVQYLISPTVREFNEIIDQQLIFEICDYYQRIALPLQI